MLNPGHLIVAMVPLLLPSGKDSAAQFVHAYNKCLRSVCPESSLFEDAIKVMTELFVHNVICQMYVHIL